jgi:hypothetical protein
LRERKNFKKRETPTGERKEMNPLGGLKDDPESESEATWNEYHNYLIKCGILNK